MQRARQRLVGLALLLLSSSATTTSSAFHAGNLFDKAPGSGGGGGLFYVGSPRERGWTCAACHTETPGRLRVRLSSEPSSLFDELAYEPGATYRLSFEIQNEALGISSPLSNYNGLAFTALDSAGSADAAGFLGGYPAEQYYTRGNNILASAGQMPNSTSFAFDWTAPAAASGSVDFFAAVVDGNSANSLPAETLTDPFGDDLWTAELHLQERGQSFGLRASPKTRTEPAKETRATLPWLAAAVSALALWGMSRVRLSRFA